MARLSLGRLVWQSLWFSWRGNLAIGLGVAVATAVITGSSLIGDSVKGSLRDSALSRLGSIEDAVVAPRFFSVRRAADVCRQTRAWAPLILLQGAVTNQATGATAPNVSIVGMDEGFSAFFGYGMRYLDRAAGVNEALAKDLGATNGDSLLLTVGKPTAAPSETLLARRKPRDTVSALRVEVASVLTGHEGMADFGLDSATTPRRILYVSREWLASAMGQPGLANALVTAGGSIESRLSGLGLQGFGLKAVQNPKLRDVSVKSDRLLLSSAQEREMSTFARDAGAKMSAVSVYLASRFVVDPMRPRTSQAGTASHPGLHRMGESSYGVIAGVEGEPRYAVAPGQIILNSWLAQDLGASVGSALKVEYMVPQRDGSSATRLRRFTVARIDSMDTANPGLTPDFEGITNAKRMSDWDPPFPIALDRITRRDEEYWDRYRAAPKAFLSMETLKEIWAEGGSPDWITGVHLVGLSKGAPRLEDRLSAADAGLMVRHVRRDALVAAEGSTDFAGLFLGLGIFIVVAAAGLSLTLTRLAVARRASQWGVMLACGLSTQQVRRAAYLEGLVLAVLGAVGGSGPGLGYAAAIIAGLRSWWNGAVGSAPLWLHVTAWSMVVGVISGFLLGSIALVFGARAEVRRPALALLAGWRSIGAGPDPRSSRGAVGGALSVLAGGAVLLATRAWSSEVGFLIAGAALLAASLLLALAVLTRRGRLERAMSVRLLASRNARASRGHSLLVFGLLAAASFVLVAVAPNVRSLEGDSTRDRASGSGGFTLIATSSVPIVADLGTPGGRAILGFSPDDEAAFAHAEMAPLLVQQGDDASCLSLSKPRSPRILGVGRQMVENSGFTIITLPGRAVGWKNLQGDGSPVPAYGDSETVQWIFHKSLGQDMALPGNGKPLTVRFVGLVERSIFAGDILISEQAFRRLFRGNDAPRLFLIRPAPGQEEAVAAAIRRALGELGVEVRTTREMLNAYAGVQNAYISSFLALGGLGLLLGTIGLAAALFRNAVDRQREFALMLACGLRRSQIVATLMWENAALLLAGVVAGTMSALVATAPLMASHAARMNLGPLLAWLGGIVLFGIGMCAWASREAVRGALIPALRSE